jgi:hypothetical protein
MGLGLCGVSNVVTVDEIMLDQKEYDKELTQFKRRVIRNMPLE